VPSCVCREIYGPFFHSTGTPPPCFCAPPLFCLGQERTRDLASTAWADSFPPPPNFPPEVQSKTRSLFLGYAFQAFHVSHATTFPFLIFRGIERPTEGRFSPCPMILPISPFHHRLSIDLMVFASLPTIPLCFLSPSPPLGNINKIQENHGFFPPFFVTSASSGSSCYHPKSSFSLAPRNPRFLTSPGGALSCFPMDHLPSPRFLILFLSPRPRGLFLLSPRPIMFVTYSWGQITVIWFTRVQYFARIGVLWVLKEGGWSSPLGPPLCLFFPFLFHLAFPPVENRIWNHLSPPPPRRHLPYLITVLLRGTVPEFQ